MSSPVQVFQVPVEADTADLIEAWEIQVPTERGDWIEVNVMRNMVRDTYEVEFSAELLSLNTEGLTATIQQAMLALKDYIARDGESEVSE